MEDLCDDDELGVASCSDDERLGVREWLRLETRPSEMAADAIEGPSSISVKDSKLCFCII
jgi:hypothetical protein